VNESSFNKARPDGCKPRQQFTIALSECLPPSVLRQTLQYNTEFKACSPQDAGAEQRELHAKAGGSQQEARARQGESGDLQGWTGTRVGADRPRVRDGTLLLGPVRGCWLW
jgi:hypothetical protein